MFASLSLYILPRYFVSLHVPSTGRSCSPLLRLATVPCLPRAFLAQSLYTGHPSFPPFTPPPRRLRDSDSKTRSGISLPSRRAPLAVASRRSRLLPSWGETPPCLPPLSVLSLSRVYLDWEGALVCSLLVSPRRFLRPSFSWLRRRERERERAN